MVDMRRHRIRVTEVTTRYSRLLSLLAVAVMGVVVLGAFSFASQHVTPDKAPAAVQSEVIRTTPDAPREVPPPVEEAKR
ncbi:hypothetical protein FHS83_003337 [Rhizomicrobium palustre]|uniref:Uncharacterized protein n=1 Tax=Rhizomicrobium palustre TaxID=189966 RepID=A0A846N3D1_9PROT|nr:hypothetical protein [Rhizomicrobium palustre]NIK90019.1 hypothetical protein [Rhizomicrobium palustre]